MVELASWVEVVVNAEADVLLMLAVSSEMYEVEVRVLLDWDARKGMAVLFVGCRKVEAAAIELFELDSTGDVNERTIKICLGSYLSH